MNRFFSVKTLYAVVVAALIVPAAVFASPEKAVQKPGKVKAAKLEAAESSTLSGKVAETMNSGGYTYVLLEKKGKKIWVAIPQTTVKVGQKLDLQPGQEMVNFHSQSLNRTFENIIFSPGAAQPQGASASPADHEGSKKAAVSAEKGIKVEKATGPNAYTVADIFAKRAELGQKTAVVRAKVVKVSAGIMGSNWIHLQDGTGDAGKKTHDLVVTTQELPVVGDIVTVSGTVAVDKDFGAGYKYSVLIEKASIQR
ncbi:MAG: DNA-binding protein [Nitrospirota bacterium]